MTPEQMVVSFFSSFLAVFWGDPPPFWIRLRYPTHDELFSATAPRFRRCFGGLRVSRRSDSQQGQSAKFRVGDPGRAAGCLPFA